MQVFVPLEDAAPDRDVGVLVPYRAGIACAHELRGGLVLRDGIWRDAATISDGSAARRPGAGPASLPRLR
jgi:hypothetical protein